MSLVKDLREALQDVVAPDLKAVVQGLAELRNEVRESNSLLHAEIRESSAQLRAEMKESNSSLRDEMRAVEARTTERIQRVYDAVKIADLTRRNAELEAAMEQIRKAQQLGEQQQH